MRSGLALITGQSITLFDCFGVVCAFGLVHKLTC